ncbi:MAG: CvpA family protein [Microscillaceae bacterium]|nr:CvpA family protein [Microscillaceae bacterium]
MLLQVAPIPQPAGGGGFDIITIIFHLLILAPIAWGAYKGFDGGVLSELVGIIHFAIFFAISFKVIGFLLKFVQQYIFYFNDTLFPEVAFACSVGGSFALYAIVGKYLKTEIEYDFPGSWDNILGAITGGLKYALIMSFFFWFIHGFGRIPPDLKNNSLIYGTVEAVALKIFGAQNHDELSIKITNSL